MRTLRTPRLRLEPVTAQNAAALWNLLQQPDLRTYQDLPSVGAAAFTELVARRPRRLEAGANGRFEWLVQLPRVRKPVGWVSLRIAERDCTSGEIGYSIVREFRRVGIATEAVRAMVDEAFREANLSRVNAYCLPQNTASRRVLAHMGFIEDGILPHGATVSGHAVDVLTHRCERERWFQSGKTMEMPASGYPA